MQDVGTLWIISASSHSVGLRPAGTSHLDSWLSQSHAPTMGISRAGLTAMGGKLGGTGACNKGSTKHLMGGPWKQQVELWRPGFGMSHRAKHTDGQELGFRPPWGPATICSEKPSEKKASAADLPVCGKLCAERWSGLPVFEKQHYAVA